MPIKLDDRELLIANFCKDYDRKSILDGAKRFNLTPLEVVMLRLPHHLGKTDGVKFANIILDRYGIDNGNPTDNGPAKVYIVMENCRSKHSDETTEVLSVHTSREKAEEVVKTNKFNILSEWKNLMDGDEDCWETENDTASNYTLARVCDYEYYYSVWVVEKSLEC